MKWIEEILGKAIFFKEGKKGWEDIVEIVEDIGICSCFPANFENQKALFVYRTLKGAVC